MLQNVTQDLEPVHRPLIRSKRRWEDNIKLDLGETGCKGVNCIHLAQDRDQWWSLLNTVMNLRAP